MNKRSRGCACLVITLSVLLAACQSPAPSAKNSVTPVTDASGPTGTTQVAAACPPAPKGMTPKEAQTLLRTAKDRGVLYRISRAGAVGYLYGTIHISRRDWMFPGKKTLAALNASKVLALELNVFDPKIKQRMTAEPEKQKPESVRMPAEFNNRIEKLAARICAPIEKLRKLRSSLLLPTLVTFDARFEGLEASYGSEAVLYQFAKQNKLPVESLETVQVQAAVLEPDNQSEQEYRKALNIALEGMESGKTRKALVQISNAWANGDLDAIENSCVNCTPSEIKKVNDDRNPGMAAGIDKLLRRGQVAFVGVGILHMVGPKALPKLLKEMGYAVERIKF